MEVHHHPQLEHKPKPWKEYFLEFIMIFLAVTMGFFAENIREFFSERTKEKEYISSIIQDLKVDKNIIDSSNVTNDSAVITNLEFLRLLKEGGNDFNNQAQLAKLYIRLQIFAVIISDPKTYDQLKSTGDFRLIKNKKALDSISLYYQQVNEQKIYADEVQTNLVNNYIFGSKVIDMTVLKFDVKQTNFTAKISDIEKIKALTKIDIYKYEYINRLTNFDFILVKYRRHSLQIKAIANSLIKLLEKEYHSENV